jgi:hypothetical protein
MSNHIALPLLYIQMQLTCRQCGHKSYGDQHLALMLQVTLFPVLPDQSKPTFLQLHEQGEIQLYELEKTSSSMYGTVTVTSWYASKGDGPLYSIKTTGLSFARAEKENNFEQLLGDNAALWARFKAEKSFSFDMLRNYIKLYNQEKKNIAPKNNEASK